MTNTTVETSQNDTVRGQTVRLFTYLKELTELRSDVKRNCDDYEQVVWWAEIPKEKECYCAAWDLGRDAAYDDWLRFERPRRKRPPAPPTVLLPWLNARDIPDAFQDVPQLKESFLEEAGSTDVDADDPETVVRRLDDCPDIKAQWERYVENQWWPWAIEERRLQPVQSIYNELFAAYQNQERMGEAYEVVVGVGLLTWRPPHGPDVRRHIAVAQAVIELDPKTGTITVGSPPDGARLTLEQEMLEPQDRPLPDLQNRIQQELLDVGDAIWAGPGLAAALNSYFQQLSPESFLEMALEPQNGATDRTRPRMNLAPALLVRQRSDRGLVRVFADIADQLSRGGAIPAGVEKLVRICDEEKASDCLHPDIEPGDTPENELYFPLPANEAQRQIAQRLASRQGVLVQGPPGTGKSHTIANLICHLLATGQRLLVTSHTARALRVLKKYFPSEFAPLCVSLLGDDTAALRELEESVQGILTKLNSWDSGKNHAWIGLMESDIHCSRRELAEGYSRLRAIRAGETESRGYADKYMGTPQQMAAAVAAEAARFGWIEANVDSDDASPLTDDEATKLLALWRDLGGNSNEEPQRALPELDAIPSPARFDQIVRRKLELDASLEAAPPRSGPLLRTLAAVTSERRHALESGLREYLALMDKLSTEQEGWIATATQEVSRGKHHSWQRLPQATGAKLQFVRDNVDQAAQLKVTGIDQRSRAEVRAHTETLHAHLVAGKGTGLSVRCNVSFRQGCVTTANPPC